MLRGEVRGPRGSGRYRVVFAQTLPEYPLNNQRRKSSTGFKQRLWCTAYTLSACSSAPFWRIEGCLFRCGRLGAKDKKWTSEPSIRGAAGHTRDGDHEKTRKAPEGCLRCGVVSTLARGGEARHVFTGKLPGPNNTNSRCFVFPRGFPFMYAFVSSDVVYVCAFWIPPRTAAETDYHWKRPKGGG
jgi:hypothetical protein